MCHTDGVKARFLQNAHAAQLCLIAADGAQKAVIMVDAGAAELHRLAVHLQATLTVKAQGADTEGVLGAVHRRFLLLQRHAAAVKIGGLGAPQLGGRQYHRFADRLLGAAQHGEGECGLGAHCARFVAKFCHHLYAAGAEITVLHGNGNIQRGVILLDIRGGYLHTVVHDVERISLKQPHITIDAAAGIPAGVGHAVILHQHTQLIVAAVV